MRDHLAAAGVEFDDRNIRQSDDARSELLARTGELVVPQLVHGGEVVVGYDPEAIDRIIAAHREEHGGTVAHDGATTTPSTAGAVRRPPANYLERDQRHEVAPAGRTLDEGLLAVLARVRDEISWNDARGLSPYRSGMHDGLRFAEDAVAALLHRHGYEIPEAASRPGDA